MRDVAVKQLVVVTDSSLDQHKKVETVGLFDPSGEPITLGGSGLPEDVYIDEYGNIIFGTDNITSFPTDRGGELSGIYVSADSTFLPPASGVTVRNVRIVRSNVDMTAVTDSSSQISETEILGCDSFFLSDVGSYLEIRDCLFVDCNTAYDAINEVDVPIGPDGFGDVSISGCQFFNSSLWITETAGDSTYILRSYFYNLGLKVETGSVNAVAARDGILTTQSASHSNFDLQGLELNTGSHEVDKVVCFGLPSDPTTFSGDNVGTYYGFGLNTLVD